MEKTSQAENPEPSRLPPESIFPSERKWFMFAAAYCGLFLLVSVFARGHPVGDEAIRAVATVLMRTTRRSDTIARLGGDEFAVLLGGSPPSTAVILAERILKAIARQRISANDSLSVSIGIATYPEDGQTVQELQEAADRALYAAKGKGGNWFVVNQQILRLA